LPQSVLYRLKVQQLFVLHVGNVAAKDHHNMVPTILWCMPTAIWLYYAIAKWKLYQIH